MDRFHLTFVIIAGGWLLIANALQWRLLAEVAENARLREICSVR